MLAKAKSRNSLIKVGLWGIGPGWGVVLGEKAAAVYYKFSELFNFMTICTYLIAENKIFKHSYKLGDYYGKLDVD